MQNKLKRKNGKLVMDEYTPEFTEVGYVEPMEHIEDDIDVMARREIEAHSHNALTAWSQRCA